ncbi:hypothetical protein FBR05_05015 [Deltaproteobacteria bacterium PRO3]|nr:hypothetical protein [Deltaproteobacteria bacterium PRO3]
MMRTFIFLSMIVGALFINACGAGCPTREVTQELSSFESYQVTVSDGVNPAFSKDISPSDSDQFASFEVTSSYINPNNPAPNDLISFQFFFPRNALPGGESIFQQSSGEIFTIPATAYTGEDVIYFETAPNTPKYLPTTFSGTVSITDPNHVYFNLTFENGSDTRHIQSVFFFQTATFDQPIGECEP